MSDLRIFIDQMKREVAIPSLPHRIVSLVPSQTEFLIDIGAPVVGRTKFCIHPEEEIDSIPIIGGTKKFRFDVIRELRPDLIIGNKEENYEEGIEKLAKDFPVWMSDIFTLEDSFEMMRSLGQICQRNWETQSVMATCRSALNAVKNSQQGRVLYLIWRKPWMAAGKDTFIDHLLGFLGYENSVTKIRYPELTDEDIQELNPEKILLSSEPYPFSNKHLAEVQALWPNVDIQLVDGELHSWYGSRLRYWK